MRYPRLNAQERQGIRRVLGGWDPTNQPKERIKEKKAKVQVRGSRVNRRISLTKAREPRWGEGGRREGEMK